MTAKAIRRVPPNGAKPANQECARPSSTSAVPVLPAIGGGVADERSAGACRDRLAHVAATASRRRAQTENGVRQLGRALFRLVGRRCGIHRPLHGQHDRRARRSRRRRAPSSAATRARPPDRSRRAAASVGAPTLSRAARPRSGRRMRRRGSAEARAAVPAARSRRCTIRRARVAG